MDEWNLQLLETVLDLVVSEPESYTTRFLFDQLTDFGRQFSQNCRDVVTADDATAGTGIYDCKAGAMLRPLIQLAHQA